MQIRINSYSQSAPSTFHHHHVFIVTYKLREEIRPDIMITNEGITHSFLFSDLPLSAGLSCFSASSSGLLSTWLLVRKRTCFASLSMRRTYAFSLSRFLLLKCGTVMSPSWDSALFFLEMMAEKTNIDTQ